MNKFSSLCSPAHSASVPPWQKVVAPALPLQDTPFPEPKTSPFSLSPNIWSLRFSYPPLVQSTMAGEAKDWWFQRVDGVGVDKGCGGIHLPTRSLIQSM